MDLPNIKDGDLAEDIKYIRYGLYIFKKIVIKILICFCNGMISLNIRSNRRSNQNLLIMKSHFYDDTFDKYTDFTQEIYFQDSTKTFIQF